MIEKIDIERFGLFKNYKWDTEVGNTANDLFKKVNIIYGRNYSGKTTLSRIFRCIEKQKLHGDYSDAKFTLFTKDSSKINESNLIYSKKIRVYNSDFVKENLSWLRDEKNGEILPFALLGGDNTVIESKIKEIEEKLGVLKEGEDCYKEGTLYFLKQQKKEETTNAGSQIRSLEKDLNDKLVNKANKHIKVNPNYVKQGASYTVNNLQKDIKEIISNQLDCILSEEAIIIRKATIREEAKKDILQLPKLDLRFSDFISKTKTLISKEITLTNTLKVLVENDLLQAWVNDGRGLHEKSETCAFCGNPITFERRKQLDEHFSKESAELEKEIKSLLEALTREHNLINKYLTNNKIEVTGFYAALQTDYNTVLNSWNESVVLFDKQVNVLKEKLEERLQNLFKPIEIVDFSSIESTSIDFNGIIGNFNKLIDKNQEKTKSLEDDKDEARKLLRYDYIKGFLDDINYQTLVNAIEEANEKAKHLSKKYDELKLEISTHENEKTELERGLKDESRASDKINKHLKNFFGHDGIRLDPIEVQRDEGKKTQFEVKRGHQKAINLSEGECSLIAFCYFMAKIEDELQDPNAKDNLIIYIDDPISSLDNNHIFFMFGLINTIITSADKVENVRFCQLFISTHNLEFLKYLHRLSPFTGLYKKENNDNMIHLLVEKRKMKDKYKSILRVMPKHLRINTTGYIYLFEQIYNIAKPHDNVADKIKIYEDNYTLIYNIGNNMRRFMEQFLSFKFAGDNDPLYLLKEFFDENESSQLNRASNEYSHLSWLEKGTTLLDIPEAERLAILILKGIKKKDEVHFNSLCKKIDGDPNIVTV